MALIHRAELVPSKTELVDAWVKSRPWFRGEAGAPLDKVAAFRFDDPEGLVGIETLFVRAGDGPVLQVPLTYRDTPLVGAEGHLIGTLSHSVLGTRYVYDGLGDPASLVALVTAVLTGATQAEEHYEIDGVEVAREPNAVVRGGGSEAAARISVPEPEAVTVSDTASSSTATTPTLRVTVSRLPASEPLVRPAPPEATLVGSWEPEWAEVTLATVAV
ncbi:CG0192-related protein [Frondihabitans australicus]|uniref:Maltokinase N-terminal cap domain-containing protein n=1 Tax=Frondihabitans australicus TaxID=386892 RepID=A0A495IBU3_9MICO|nr:hypothetical protein [Frondihabitans australicus]RKR73389.1 hypothetical protein C8E83_0481 [Frondihabitans australicus]